MKKKCWEDRLRLSRQVEAILPQVGASLLPHRCPSKVYPGCLLINLRQLVEPHATAPYYSKQAGLENWQLHVRSCWTL
jgi:hypothetical protein